MSEGKNKPANALRTRWQIITCVLLAAGGVVSFLGTRSGNLTVKDTNPIHQPLPANTQPVKAPMDEASRQRIELHGAQLAKEMCLGCHAVDEQLAGPTWRQIVDASKDEHAGTLSELAARMEHPPGNWTSYSPGPKMRLMPADRLALAVWIDQSVRQTGEQK